MNENGELVYYKANQLVQEYKVQLSLSEMRIVNYLIANIDSPKYDKEFREFRFDIREFTRIVYPDREPSTEYKRIPLIIQKLADKSAWKIVEDEETGKMTKALIRWIEEPEINLDDGIIKLRLHKRLAPYLLQLEKGYFKALFKYTIDAQSKYTIPLYEFLKSWEKVKGGIKVVNLQELRERMDATEKSKDNIAEFKRRALDPAVKEINAFTDLFISYETIKVGRKVEQIKFTIKIKDKLLDGKDENEDLAEDFFKEVKGKKKKATTFGLDITDEQRWAIYEIVAERIDVISENMPSNKKDALTEEAVKRILLKAKDRDIHGSVYNYILGIINKDEKLWEDIFNEIEDERNAKEKEKRAKEAEVILKKEDELAEEEMDERVREYYEKKAAELGLSSWEEARDHLNPGK